MTGGLLGWIGDNARRTPTKQTTRMGIEIGSGLSHARGPLAKSLALTGKLFYNETSFVQPTPSSSPNRQTTRGKLQLPRTPLILNIRIHGERYPGLCHFFKIKLRRLSSSCISFSPNRPFTFFHCWSGFGS